MAALVDMQAAAVVALVKQGVLHLVTQKQVVLVAMV
jgi:hypothetical protein